MTLCNSHPLTTHHLVKEQNDIFKQFALYLRTHGSKDQFLIYARGAIGTKKIQRIKAMKEFFHDLNMEHKLRIGDYTECASIIIGGSTLHSIVELLVDSSIDASIVNPTIPQCDQVEYLIIDEVSTIGCTMLATLHLKLHKLKSNMEPFGNVNIFFMGDFMQFLPINDTPFYSINIQPSFLFIQRTQKKIEGKSLWENYIHPNIIIFYKNETSKRSPI